MIAWAQNNTLLTIGQFGRLSQLSRKALRLYAERGILSPAWVDPASGYRYYQRWQIAVARRVRLMRLMEMPLESIVLVLQAWETDTAVAQRHIQSHLTTLETQLNAAQLAARLLRQEILPQKEQNMSFQFQQKELPAQLVLSIRRSLTIPAYHQWLKEALSQLFHYIEAAGQRPCGNPIALYYGPVNEEDDGPVEICVPFAGVIMPQGEMKVRQLPAHKAIQITTFGEYNEYPKLLEMWNALARYVDEQKLESNWDADMTTYEIWHEDYTMTLGWPVQAFD